MKTYSLVFVLSTVIFAQEISNGVYTQQTTSSLKYSDSRILFREIMKIGAILVGIAEENDFEVVKVDIDLVGKSNAKQTLKVFSQEFAYTVSVAGSPSRIDDTDLRIYYVSDNGDKILVAEDKKVDYVAAVSFTPVVSGTYLIETQAYKMKPGHERSMGFYFLVIAHN